MRVLQRKEVKMDFNLNKVKRVCFNCGQHINIKAQECPYCHKPQPPLNEKQKAIIKFTTRVYLVLFVVLLLIPVFAFIIGLIFRFHNT